MLIKILYDFLIFLLITSTNNGPCHAFYTRTKFHSIEDVEYIPKFGYRNHLNPIFFHIIVLKDPKGYKNIKKIFELI